MSLFALHIIKVVCRYVDFLYDRPGEVFVHRNVGNLVPGNDVNVLSVLEHAVINLGVTDIIVTGTKETYREA
jgi:carbonic anhydrase